MGKKKQDVLTAPPSPPDTSPAPQRASLELRVGSVVAMRSTVEMTPQGLLAVGGLAAAVLLSTAVLLRMARR